MGDVTIHCMVRNEPFVYYAVKSVYPLAHTILLYDTGSCDKHTIADIRQLMVEDREDKIVFERVPIEFDQTPWTTRPKDSNFHAKMSARNEGKRGAAYCRQKMIDDTQTPFFMIVDGDEVHYKSNHEPIRRAVIEWPKGKLCGVLPLVWFKHLNQTFWNTSSGRIFKTDEVCIKGIYPSEMHTGKKGQKLRHPSVSFNVPRAIPYAHFESYLKPWRRDIHTEDLVPFDGPLPEVMMENDEYIRRLEGEDPIDRSLHG